MEPLLKVENLRIELATRAGQQLFLRKIAE